MVCIRMNFSRCKIAPLSMSKCYTIPRKSYIIHTFVLFLIHILPSQNKMPEV